MKEYVEILLFGRYNIFDNELLSHILDGFDSEYNSTIITLNSKIESKYDKSSIQDVQYLFQKMS